MFAALLKLRERDNEEYEKRLEELKEQIRAIEDLPSLRAAEQAIMMGLIDNTIESKVAPALAQLLKHQADLLKDLKPPEETLDEHQKQRVIQLTMSMPANEAWLLMQDFVTGIRSLERQVKKEMPPRIEAAEEAEVIEVKNGRSEDAVCERPGGATHEDRPKRTREAF